MIPVNRVENPMRTPANFRRHFKLIWAVQSFPQKMFRLTRRANQRYRSRRPPGKGALRGRHERGLGCGGRGSVRRERRRRAGLL